MNKTPSAPPPSSPAAVAVLEYDCPVYGNNSDFVIEQGNKNSFGTDFDQSLFWLLSVLQLC